MIKYTKYMDFISIVVQALLDTMRYDYAGIVYRKQLHLF